MLKRRLRRAVERERRRVRDTLIPVQRFLICLASGVPATKGYILRSTLPDTLLPLLSEPRPISLEGADARVNLAAPTGGEGDGVDCGALIDWQKGDGGPTGGIAMVGLLWVVLGTILVHDRVLTEGE
jgi:hypothetical protein